MKKTLLVMLFTVISMPSLADDEVALTEASPSYIQSVLDTCKDYAVEDEVDANDLNKYLLECINDDLDENDYEQITSLPVA